MSAYIDEIKRSRKAPGVTEIRIPGERAFAARGENLRRGRVPVYEVVWTYTSRIAAELNVAMPG